MKVKFKRENNNLQIERNKTKTKIMVPAYFVLSGKKHDNIINFFHSCLAQNYP